MADKEERIDDMVLQLVSQLFLVWHIRVYSRLELIRRVSTVRSSSYPHLLYHHIIIPSHLYRGIVLRKRSRERLDALRDPLEVVLLLLRDLADLAGRGVVVNVGPLDPVQKLSVHHLLATNATR